MIYKKNLYVIMQKLISKIIIIINSMNLKYYNVDNKKATRFYQKIMMIINNLISLHIILKK